VVKFTFISANINIVINSLILACRIQASNADPDPGGKMNAEDYCESGSKTNCTGFFYFINKICLQALKQDFPKFDLFPQVNCSVGTVPGTCNL